MKNHQILKGVLFVALGASCYGMLATFVKLAYQEHYTTGEVTTAQFSIGLLGLLLINLFRKNHKSTFSKPLKKDFRKLLLTGLSLGCTSLFYYLSVQYINVSIAIVILMQSVWFSVMVEAVIGKKWPSARKILATLIVLGGTLFATNALDGDVHLDIRGIFWGIMAAASYTVTMYASNRIANYLPAYKKSFIMLSAGCLVVFLFLFFSQIGPYHFEFIRGIYSNFASDASEIQVFKFSIFYKYGIILALFGTIIPPIFFNIGFPKAGLGLGSIVSSLELPISVIMAHLLLQESILPIQWLGIGLILFAIILMNLPEKKIISEKI